MSFLIFFLTFAWASPQTHYDNGISLLRDDKLSDAQAAFVLCLKEGGIDSRVYHALGNAFHLQGDMPRALAAWRRGLILSPASDELRHNLELIDSLPPIRMSARLSPEMWSCLGSLSVCTSLFIWLILSRRGRRRFASLLLILGLVSAWMAWLSAQNRFEAVLVADPVLLSSSPTPGHEILTLRSGEMVRILRTSGNYSLIMVSEVQNGWVSKSALVSFDPKDDFPLEVR